MCNTQELIVHNETWFKEILWLCFYFLFFSPVWVSVNHEKLNVWRRCQHTLSPGVYNKPNIRLNISLVYYMQLSGAFQGLTSA